MLALLSFCGTSNDAWGQEDGNLQKIIDTDTTVFVVSFGGKQYAMSNEGNEEEKGMKALSVNVAGEKVINYYGDSIKWEIARVREKPDTAAYIMWNKKYLCGSSDGNGGDLRLREDGHDIWIWKDTLGGIWIDSLSLTASKGERTFYIETDEKNPVPVFKNHTINDLAHQGNKNHLFSKGGSLSVEWIDAKDAYVRENLDSASYGTICLPRSVAANDYSGATFYSIAGKGKVDTDSLLYLTKVDSLVKGTPYIFFTNDTILTVAYHDTVSVAIAVEGTNGLMGNLQDDTLAVVPGMYMIDDNQVKKCGTDCKLAKNRAYIDMSNVPEYDPKSQINAKVRVISIGGSIGGTTHVAAVTADSDKVDVYTIGGVMVRRKAEAATATAGLQKGIYIVNHKKVAVK